jgi:hypothetical protein
MVVRRPGLRDAVRSRSARFAKYRSRIESPIPRARAHRGAGGARAPEAPRLDRDRRRRYGLTALGGAAWEERAQPDWSRFIDDSSDGDFRCVEGADLERLRRCIEWREPDYELVGEPVFERLRPFQATYWKALPEGFRATRAVRPRPRPRGTTGPPVRCGSPEHAQVIVARRDFLEYQDRRFRLTALRQDPAIANAAAWKAAPGPDAPCPAARGRAADRRKAPMAGSCAYASLPPSQESEKECV